MTAPTTPPSDITGLIERMKLWGNIHGVMFSFGIAERDTIVLALRVLRVLRHPDCDEGHFTGTGKLVFTLANNSKARRLLDDAERLLGIADEGGER